MKLEHLEIEIRNAYDARDRDALERALAQLQHLADVDFAQKWRASFSLSFPNSHRVQMVHIHHPNGDTQTLYDPKCERGRWFSPPALNEGATP